MSYVQILQAVCCQDQMHCCPYGYVCDGPRGACQKGYVSMPWFEKQPAKPIEDTTDLGDKDVMCGDKKTKCADGQTCCKLKSGQWGCCPMPKVNAMIL